MSQIFHVDPRVVGCPSPAGGGHVPVAAAEDVGRTAENQVRRAGRITREKVAVDRVRWWVDGCGFS